MKPSSNLLFAAGCVFLTECISAGLTDPSQHPEVLEALAINVALVHYTDFASRSEEMAQASVTFCTTPDEAAITTLREAAWAARGPWKRSEVILFGPVVDYPLRLGPKLDDWPVNGEAVEDLVAADSKLDQTAFDAMGSATRGLPVVEYLLWADADGTAPLAALTRNNRRCDVLVGAATDVALNATRLRDAWQNEWVIQLSDPSTVENSAYETTQSVVDEWVNRMAFTVENIRVTKLGKPAGDDSNGALQPDIIESRLSGRSLTDARDALQGVYDVWTGQVGDGELGIRDLVQNDTVVEQLGELFTLAVERLDRLTDPLEETLLVEPEMIAWAQEPLRQLQTAIQSELATAVGTTLQFNDADGD